MFIRSLNSHWSVGQMKATSPTRTNRMIKGAQGGHRAICSILRLKPASQALLVPLRYIVIWISIQALFIHGHASVPDFYNTFLDLEVLHYVEHLVSIRLYRLSVTRKTRSILRSEVAGPNWLSLHWAVQGTEGSFPIVVRIKWCASSISLVYIHLLPCWLFGHKSYWVQSIQQAFS